MGVTIIEPRPSAITFAAIDVYARRYGIGPIEFDLLVGPIVDADGESYPGLLRAIDDEYLAVQREQAEERARQRG